MDVRENGGGDSTIGWYKIFFQKPFQDMYVQFKKTHEFSTDLKIQDELLYREKGKHAFLEKLKLNGTWDKIKEGQFLPSVPQFCRHNGEDCDSLFAPNENQFSGDVKILVDQWCISSCTGFIWTIKDILGDRVKFYGFPDSGDSAYGRVLLDLYLDPSVPDGFQIKVAGRKSQTKNKIPDGALLRQSVSVTRSTGRTGKIISAIPVKMDGWVPVQYHYFGKSWDEQVLEKALKDI